MSRGENAPDFHRKLVIVYLPQQKRGRNDELAHEKGDLEKGEERAPPGKKAISSYDCTIGRVGGKGRKGILRRERKKRDEECRESPPFKEELYRAGALQEEFMRRRQESGRGGAAS